MNRPPKPLLLALLASPRPRGANARLLSAFLRGVRGWEVKRLSCADLAIAPYPGSPKLSASRPAALDPMAELIGWFDRADALILASPVYFYAFPAQAKAIIDRCEPLWHNPRWRHRPHRPAFFIATCAAPRRSEFEVIRREAKAFLHTLGFRLAGELLLPGLDRRDAAQRLRSACVRARRLGARFSPASPIPVKLRHG